MYKQEATNNCYDLAGDALCSCAFPTTSLLSASQKDDGVAELSQHSPRTPEHRLEGKPWHNWAALNEEQPTSISYREGNVPFVQPQRTCSMLCPRYSLTVAGQAQGYDGASELQHPMLWQEDSKFCGCC